MIRVDFVRHGECLDDAFLRGHTPSELSELGVRQMQTVFSILPKPDWVISSPAKRCVQPTKYDYEDPDIWSDFQERSFGIWDGLSYEAVRLLDPVGLKEYLKQPFTFNISKSETLGEFEFRIVSAFKKVLEYATTHALNRVLIVTHGGVMRVLLKSVLGLNNPALFQFEMGFSALMTLECFVIKPSDFLLNTESTAEHSDFEQEGGDKNLACLSEYFIKLVALTPCLLTEAT